MLNVALSYIARGWNPVPIPHRTKAPRGDGWQHRRITQETAPHYFNGAASNIGVQLGAASNGLTDVDLDCAETIAIAPYILPATKAIFGRASKRNSHRLYVTHLAATTDTATVLFKDPRTKAVLLELRIGGGDKGAQTVFPCSVHPDGEPINWEENGEPATVDGDELARKVRLVAAFALMARYWPGDGGRHDAARVIGGFLARAGQHRTQVKVCAEAVAKAADDEEWRDRRAAAEDAAIAYRGGKHAYGFNGMRETFGQDIAEKIAEWLDYRCGDDPPPQSDACEAPETLSSPISPLPISNMSRWDDEPAPDPEWGVFNRFPMFETVLLSGEGGARERAQSCCIWLPPTPSSETGLVPCRKAAPRSWSIARTARTLSAGGLDLSAITTGSRSPI